MSPLRIIPRLVETPSTHSRTRAVTSNSSQPLPKVLSTGSDAAGASVNSPPGVAQGTAVVRFCQVTSGWPGEPLPLPFGDERFEAAWTDPCVAGFAHWARFPAADFEPTPDGWQVVVSDLRYVDPRGSRDSLGFGTAVVKVESP